MTVDESITKFRVRFPELAEAVSNQMIRNAFGMSENWRFPSEVAQLFALAHLAVSESGKVDNVPGEVLSVDVGGMSRTFRSQSGRPGSSYWMGTRYGRNYVASIRAQPGAGGVAL